MESYPLDHQGSPKHSYHLWVCFYSLFFSCVLAPFFSLFACFIIFECMLHIGYKRKVKYDVILFPNFSLRVPRVASYLDVIKH